MLKIPPKIKLGINGFGRIGRLITRIVIGMPNIELVAINNPSTTPEYMAYLFKYDSVHGKFNGKIEYNDNQLIINNKHIDIYRELKPFDIKWSDSNADYIIESTGRFTTLDQASLHLNGGSKKVIVTSPSQDIPMFVMGVNENKYSSNINIVSNASCTTNCLAPLVKVIDDNFCIVEGFVTTIHAITASQKTVDSSSVKDWRAGRSTINNIIPSSTGASKVITKIYPHLNEKIKCMSFRVPIIDVSTIDCTIKIKKEVSLEEVINIIKNYSDNELIGILGYTRDDVVSSDFIGDSRSCIVDIKSSMILGNNFIKLVAWYDNEWGYSNRVVNLLEYMYKVDNL